MVTTTKNTLARAQYDILKKNDKRVKMIWICPVCEREIERNWTCSFTQNNGTPVSECCDSDMVFVGVTIDDKPKISNKEIIENWKKEQKITTVYDKYGGYTCISCGRGAREDQDGNIYCVNCGKLERECRCRPTKPKTNKKSNK